MGVVGLIARANDKGLGYQTYEAYRHFPFARTLVVLMRDKDFVDHPERYANGPCTFVRYENGELPEPEVRAWLKGLDAVFSCETLYDWRLADWARDAGARTVVQGNPEFYVHHQPERMLASPDEWVWPTHWRPFSELPDGVELPVPVPDDVPHVAADAEVGPFTVLHVAGHRAAGDRNGTDSFLQSLRHVRSDVVVRVVTQDGQLPNMPETVPPNVKLDVRLSGLADRWSLYEDVHLVVLPRRYGGNSLPANEACAAGCAVAMPLVDPNQRWPIFPFNPAPAKNHRAPCGFLPTCLVRPYAIGAAIDSLNANRRELADLQRRSFQWTCRNTWSALLPRYHGVLS